MMDSRIQTLPVAVWQLLAFTAIVLLFAVISLLSLYAQYRRWRSFAACLLLAPVCYFLAQAFIVLKPPPSLPGARPITPCGSWFSRRRPGSRLPCFWP